MNTYRILAASATLLTAGMGTTHALTIDLNPVADTFVAHRANNGALNTNYGTSTDLDLHQQAGIYMFAYVRFDLSVLGAGAVINSATLTFTKSATNTLEAGYPLVSTRNDGMTTSRFGAYGLLDTLTNTAQDWSETGLTYNTIGGEKIAEDNTQFDTVNSVVSFDGVNETVTATTASITGSGSDALVAFLTARLNAGTFTGLTTFIIDAPNADAGRGFALVSREGAVGIPVLTIDYTPSAVPEPSAFAAIAGVLGLGFAASRRRRSA